MFKNKLIKNILNNNEKNIFQEDLISEILNENEDNIKKILGESIDIVYSKVTIPFNTNCMLVYLSDLIDIDFVNNELLFRIINIKNDKIISKKLINVETIKTILGIAKVKECTSYIEILGHVLDGNSVLFIDGIKIAFLLDTKKVENRKISEPGAETIVRGSKEGFIENLSINRSLIRKRIKNSNLTFEEMTIGKQTHTTINIVYLKNLVDNDILTELKKRLYNINIDSVLDSGYIEELISDFPLSPFKTVGYTERPDTVVGKILEGRIGILCDGTPSALTIPYLFLEDFQSIVDYYQNFLFASINRIIRYLAYFITISIPGIYVALVAYHQQMIPYQLLISIISSREGVPFPTIVEVFVMILVFELIREASVRMPSPLGQTISIVGALVLGQAAVEAKFVSAPVVIVVAITGISSFIFYKEQQSVMITRFFLTTISSFMGLYGYILGLISLFLILIYHSSFGVPYMSNMGLSTYKLKQDIIIRSSWLKMIFRPKSVSKKNIVRKGL